MKVRSAKECITRQFQFHQAPMFLLLVVSARCCRWRRHCAQVREWRLVTRDVIRQRSTAAPTVYDDLSTLFSVSFLDLRHSSGSANVDHDFVADNAPFVARCSVAWDKSVVERRLESGRQECFDVAWLMQVWPRGRKVPAGSK